MYDLVSAPPVPFGPESDDVQDLCQMHNPGFIVYSDRSDIAPSRDLFCKNPVRIRGIFVRLKELALLEKFSRRAR